MAVLELTVDQTGLEGVLSAETSVCHHVWLEPVKRFRSLGLGLRDGDLKLKGRVLSWETSVTLSVSAGAPWLLRVGEVAHCHFTVEGQVSC